MSIISMTEAERQEIIDRLKRWLHAVRVADRYASGIGGISEKTDDDLHDLEFALEAEETAKRIRKEKENGNLSNKKRGHREGEQPRNEKDDYGRE